MYFVTLHKLTNHIYVEIEMGKKISEEKKYFGSVALNGKMLALGLLKISCFFPYF